jgi:cytochrome bd ubiquinol oxidase subunit I
MHFDPLILSRLQFAWVIGFHILLPAFTVGLASFIAVLEGMYLYTGREDYLRISLFWIKIFAISFGMGVVSGIVMPFQLGTNWSKYADTTANIIAPLLGYEGLTAFFLEASFLGVLLFGRHLVPRWVLFFSALMVAFGTLFSTFWILSANSWMQTPAGYKTINGLFFPENWLHIVFNPSFPYRLAHNVVGFYITTGFAVIGVAAYYLRRKVFVNESRLMFSMTLWLLTFLVPLQLFLGDLHGLNTLKYQPAKLAAIEGHWDPEKRAPLLLFALPDQKNETNHAVIEIPLLGSLILTHSLGGQIPGLKQWPRDQRAPVIIPFFSFRIMVGLGLIMLVMVILSLWLRYRHCLFDTSWFLRLCQFFTPIGFLTILAGWVTTEVGRQPWTVYGLLRTADSVTPSLTGNDVLISLVCYIVVYLLIYPFGIFLMASLIRKTPAQISTKKDVIAGGQPSTPVITPPEYGNHGL